jgi:hypothetical protein
MFSLIKLVIEAAFAAALFIGGVKFGIKYPTIGTKIDTLISWGKSVL